MRKHIALLLVFTIALTIALTGCGSDEDHYIGVTTDFSAPENLSDGEGRAVKVILLMGQSNATGVALNSYLEENVGREQYALYERGFSNVLINFSVDNELNSSGGEFVSTTVGCGHRDIYFGPELGIAEKLSEAYPDQLFVILKYTYSGSCLKTQWLDGWGRGELYDAALKFTSTYMDALISHNFKPELSAICWMQGESDSVGSAADEYYRNQSLFVYYLRRDLEKYAAEGGIYFIDGGIQEAAIWPKHETVNRAKERFAKKSPLNMYFSTAEAGLTTEGEPEGSPDIAHYDSLSCLKLGHLFGEHIIRSYQTAD